MDKQELLLRIKSKGYKADMLNGIPTVHVDGSNSKRSIKELKAFLGELGYNSSFGVKYDGGTSVMDVIDDEMSDQGGSESAGTVEAAGDITKPAAGTDESNGEYVEDTENTPERANTFEEESSIFDMMGLDLFD